MVAHEELVWKHRTSPGGIVTFTGVEVPSKYTCRIAFVLAVDGFLRQIEPSKFTHKFTTSFDSPLDLLAAISSVSGQHALNIKEVKNGSVTVVRVIRKTGADFNNFFIDRKFKKSEIIASQRGATRGVFCFWVILLANLHF